MIFTCFPARILYDVNIVESLGTHSKETDRKMDLGPIPRNINRLLNKKKTNSFFPVNYALRQQYNTN